MRKLLTILGLLISIVSSAQFDTTKFTSNFNSNLQYYNQRVLRNFQIPVFGKWATDTTSKVPGSVKLIGNTLYYSGTDGFFHPVLSSASDFYTTNGTLSSNRSVAGNQKDFFLTDAKQIYFKVNNPSQAQQGGLNMYPDFGIELSYSNVSNDAGLSVPSEGEMVQLFANGNMLEVSKDSITVNGKNIVRSINGSGANVAGDVSVDLSNYIQKQTQNPTATLTGGETRELMSSGGDLSYTLTWGAGRAAATTSAQATTNISTINVAGTNETFSNPSAGSTVSGTQGVSVVRNTNTTLTNTVTTSDGKTATATISVIFQPKRYWFYSTSATPTSSDVVAALGGGSELSTSISKSSFTITPSGGNQYLSYSYPSSEGGLSSINIGGFESISSFTQRTVSVTNATGYVQNYFVYTSNNLLPTTTINSIN